MARFRLTVEYDGTAFVGWQRQDNGPSVQGEIERAAQAVGNGPVTLFGAGRTDTGVHALAQVAHFDTERPWTAAKLRDALNAKLRDTGIAILDVAEVGEDFHCRFSATSRSYLYRILNRRPPPAIEIGRVWWIKSPLDADAMHDAARRLVGHHDFTTFRSTHCQSRSPEKTLDELRVSRHGEHVEIFAKSRSFLHNQVRSMAGTLVEVGLGRWSADDVSRALEARDRTACGPVAPAAGLYLVSVGYD